MNIRRAKPTVLFGGLALIMLALVVVFGLLLSAQLAKATSDFRGLDKERKELKKEVEGKPLSRLRDESRKIDEQLGGVAVELNEREYIPIFTERIEDLRSMRLRNVEIIFAGQVPGGLEDLPGVSDLEVQAGNRVQLKLKGEIDPLIKRVARYEVADFSVGHASLEDAFLEFYGSSGEKAEEEEQ